MKTCTWSGWSASTPDGKLDGGVLFQQLLWSAQRLSSIPGEHVYKGIFGQPNLSFKWTAGLLYGYVEPYEDKVPFNYNGFSPGIVLALAYEFRPGWAVQLDALGNSGLMIQLQYAVQIIGNKKPRKAFALRGF